MWCLNGLASYVVEAAAEAAVHTLLPGMADTWQVNLQLLATQCPALGTALLGIVIMMILQRSQACAPASSRTCVHHMCADVVADAAKPACHPHGRSCYGG